MYNRYIPQPDGSFCRHQFPEAPVQKQTPCSPPDSEPQAEQICPHQMPPISPSDRCHQCPGCQKKPHPEFPPTASGVSSFLNQILPKDLDSGDLMVILLLLLMAGDCPENQNNALLTLALYLFL